ncbi:MAG: HEAT repeat domain-containing protein, partial [Armatimonadota bacterium]|nr:HEAT repeat domain-containing protein [Armatimonadota bacterium]MDW8144100.1 HEAT repeat domain-containing protein [Armatimonadota bacterium]
LVYEADEQANTEFEDSVRQSAKEALEKLGKGELADALLQVLNREQDKEAIEKLRHWLPQYRSTIVKALTSALKGRNTFAAIQAAWALKRLNAVEALEVLERVAHSPRKPQEVRKACQEAISWLRAVATLPSPADLTRISTENLPSIPHKNAIPTDTLPRTSFIVEESD